MHSLGELHTVYFVFCAFLKLFVEINMKEYVNEGVVLCKVNFFFFFDWALSVLIILFYCYFFK